jgi:hypothetical protein
MEINRQRINPEKTRILNSSEYAPGFLSMSIITFSRRMLPIDVTSTIES